MASNAENVSIWWRHHVLLKWVSERNGHWREIYTYKLSVIATLTAAHKTRIPSTEFPHILLLPTKHECCTICHTAAWSLSLTHCVLVTIYGVIDLSQRWFRWFLVFWRHQIINELVLIYHYYISLIPWHSTGIIFTASALATTLYNEYQNYVFDIAVASTRGKCA